MAVSWILAEKEFFQFPDAAETCCSNECILKEHAEGDFLQRSGNDPDTLGEWNRYTFRQMRLLLGRETEFSKLL